MRRGKRDVAYRRCFGSFVASPHLPQRITAPDGKSCGSQNFAVRRFDGELFQSERRTVSFGAGVRMHSITTRPPSRAGHCIQGNRPLCRFPIQTRFFLGWASETAFGLRSSFLVMDEHGQAAAPAGLGAGQSGVCSWFHWNTPCSWFRRSTYFCALRLSFDGPRYEPPKSLAAYTLCKRGRRSGTTPRQKAFTKDNLKAQV